MKQWLYPPAGIQPSIYLNSSLLQNDLHGLVGYLDKVETCARKFKIGGYTPVNQLTAQTVYLDRQIGSCALYTDATAIGHHLQFGTRAIVDTRGDILFDVGKEFPPVTLLIGVERTFRHEKIGYSINPGVKGRLVQNWSRGIQRLNRCDSRATGKSRSVNRLNRGRKYDFGQPAAPLESRGGNVGHPCGKIERGEATAIHQGRFAHRVDRGREHQFGKRATPREGITTNCSDSLRDSHV